MTAIRILFASTALCTVSSAAVRSGKAAADWITSSATITGGTEVATGLRLAVDPGYHTYWVNPGEGGMRISVKWDLPPGWKAADPLFPVPKRFMTGDLPGFGYEGTVVFPVAITPPAEFTGKATLKGKFSWLTCDDKGCIPGSADLELTLTAGEPTRNPESRVLDAAFLKVPATPPNRIVLKVTEKPKSLVLTISGLTNAKPNLAEYETFPATPQVIDNSAIIRFSREGQTWTSEVPKSEYATKAVNELTLVLAGKPGEKPISLTWKYPGK